MTFWNKSPFVEADSKILKELGYLLLISSFNYNNLKDYYYNFYSNIQLIEMYSKIFNFTNSNFPEKNSLNCVSYSLSMLSSRNPSFIPPPAPLFTFRHQSSAS